MDCETYAWLNSAIMVAIGFGGGSIITSIIMYRWFGRLLRKG